MDTSAATGRMHAPGSGGVPEKRPVPGGEKRMTKLLHGNEKNSLTGGREPLFSQKELLVLAVPLLVEQLLEVTVGMADTMMVSRCGEAAISGVSLVDMINNLIIVLFAALATGGAVVVSQYLGAKERGNADKSAGQLLLLSGLSGVVIGAVCFVLARPMIRLFYGSIDTDVLDAGVKYLQIIALSYPFLALYNGGAALFRSIGNSKISMQISFLMNIINIVGNAVCIFGFKMGVDGVAWPSVVSRVVAAALILRKTYPQLSDLVDKSQMYYRRAFPEAQYNATSHVWVFPSGAKIWFGSMQYTKDRTNYQGKAYDFIGFDELTHFEWDEYSYMMSRNRPTGPGTRVYMRATTNPGGIGHGWVKARFITPAPPGTPIVETVTVRLPDGTDQQMERARVFIPSSVFDNPALLANDPGYLASLASLPEAQKQAPP